ncbi:PulJ/GspJ family protein [Halobacillus litoralis]|uniref:Prepilin-type cleavage/methylation domain-containing protein n=1 Tax=Halobacillus litoralis TaxID=45668 RepID=A0A410MH99_9BACI|nr:prepilin-type N-terminal cleavage/methylation domain-containing protein [Halobacillus litoralis]QAS54035.1 hypothetical protein HLI_18385 [Halobacillus litoralis]
MSNFADEKGYSLVEVIVAMALLLIVFIVSTQIVMNTIAQSEKIDKGFTSTEVADGVLTIYQSKSLDELKSQLNSDVNVDIADLLQVENPSSVEDYTASVKVTYPDSMDLKNHLLKVVVTVESNINRTELEGYVEL